MQILQTTFNVACSFASSMRSVVTDGALQHHAHFPQVVFGKLAFYPPRKNAEMLWHRRVQVFIEPLVDLLALLSHDVFKLLESLLTRRQILRVLTLFDQSDTHKVFAWNDLGTLFKRRQVRLIFGVVRSGLAVPHRNLCRRNRRLPTFTEPNPVRDNSVLIKLVDVNRSIGFYTNRLDKVSKFIPQLRRETCRGGVGAQSVVSLLAADVGI